MSHNGPATFELIAQIRANNADAWALFIRTYEGRLYAYAYRRLGNVATAEDVVQETFLGFLVSLPHYDDEMPVEAFLFSIAGHKLIDALRKEGRRPPLVNAAELSGLAGRERPASSLIRSQEGRETDRMTLGTKLTSLAKQCLSQGDFVRLKCLELLFGHGLTNKVVAQRLGISEQAVANHKQYALKWLARMQD
jgi:RNA polymerase sigma-70 factor, ECF subfamily